MIFWVFSHRLILLLVSLNGLVVSFFSWLYNQSIRTACWGLGSHWDGFPVVLNLFLDPMDNYQFLTIIGGTQWFYVTCVLVELGVSELLSKVFSLHFSECQWTKDRNGRIEEESCRRECLPREKKICHWYRTVGGRAFATRSQESCRKYQAWIYLRNQSSACASRYYQRYHGSCAETDGYLWHLLGQYEKVRRDRTKYDNLWCSLLLLLTIQKTFYFFYQSTSVIILA